MRRKAPPALDPDPSRVADVGDASTAMRRLVRTVVALGAVAVALFTSAVVATFAFTVSHHARTIHMAADLVENSITRTLESAETTLIAVGNAVRAPGPGNPAARQERLLELLDQSLRFAPYFREIVVTDRHGHILLDSTDTDGLSAGVIDLAALGIPGVGSTMDTAPGAPLFRGQQLGRVVPGRYLPRVGKAVSPSPRDVLPMVVAAGPDLLVLASLNPAHMRRMLAEGQVSPRSSVRLTRLDGTPLLAVEDPDTSMLTGYALPLMDEVRAGNETGMIVLPGTLTVWPKGRVAFRLSARYPVAVVVGMPRADMVDRWLETTGTLLFWDLIVLGAVFVGAVYLLRESLNRLRLEQRLRLVGLTEAVFAHSAEAMLVTDRENRIVAANPTFLQTTRHAAEEVLGTTPDAFLAPAAPETVAEESGRTPSGHDETQYAALPHWWLRCDGGDARAVEVRSAPLNAETTIVTLNDITERITAERALREALREAELANRAKSEFLASMSHELRTPLNAILGFSEIIRDEMFGPVGSPRYVDYANDIHGSGAHLRDIINDLLDLARIEAGKLDLHPEPLDVNDEVGVCCRLVRERATNHGLTLTVETRAEPATLLADRRVLRQMVFNLLSNAIKFTPKGGHVFVTCRYDAGVGLSVAVRDTGIGIPQEEQHRIFESYERAINTQTRHIEGSGLGLALVKSMMDLHDGTVMLDSTPGKGSTFTLLFPESRVRRDTR